MEKLEEYTEYETEDVKNFIDGAGMPFDDANSYIYAIMYFMADAMKNAVKSHHLVDDDKIDNLDPRIYTNCLDSFFDSPFENYDPESLQNKETALKFLKDFGLL